MCVSVWYQHDMPTPPAFTILEDVSRVGGGGMEIHMPFLGITRKEGDARAVWMVGQSAF